MRLLVGMFFPEILDPANVETYEPFHDDETNDPFHDDETYQPSFNIDGTPMIGSLDVNGNPYGFPDHHDWRLSMRDD